MLTPREDEYVKEDEVLEVAIRQMVLGRHLSLLVTRDQQVVGILRLSDVFEHITKEAKND